MNGLASAIGLVTRVAGPLCFAIVVTACATPAGTPPPDRVGPCTLTITGADGNSLDSPYRLEYPAGWDRTPPEVTLRGTGWTNEHITYGMLEGLPRTIDADLDEGATVRFTEPGQWAVEVTGNECYRGLTFEIIDSTGG